MNGAPRPAMTADLVSVQLPRWQWIYFLGWLEARRTPAGETVQITGIAQAIADAIKT